MIRELDENGDIKAGLFITGREMFAQNVGCSLQFFKGENPFDLDEGIDWLNELPRVDIPKLKVLIEDVIINTPGFVRFSEPVTLTTIRLKRKIVVTASVVTIYDKEAAQIEVEI